MRFEKYFVPETRQECFALLEQYGDKAKVLAGGTDVIQLLKSGALKPEAVIDIRKVEGISETKITDQGLALGAMVRLRELSLNEALATDYPVIMEAAGHVSSMQIRSMATIGGNVCNASPSADAVQGLILMNATAVIESAGGNREIPIAQFFTGPGKTVLKKGELLVGFTIPKPSARTGAFYEKFSIRGDTDITIVGAGASVTLAEDGTVSGAVVSLASVAPTPLRMDAVEKMLVGKKLTPELIDQAAQAASKSVAPITDQRASAGYRVEMVYVWTKSALTKALERAIA
ncbi:MAG: xanthine dehydrogenase family protein subunit M [Oscillospiraceae bacterium]|nr:xanthine dehydrogenase family protein subunit M [Oscillospiraceae bacterium]